MNKSKYFLQENFSKKNPNKRSNMKDIITFDEYNNSLDSSEYVDLIQLMQNRLSMPRQEIDKVIDNHFNFAYSIKKNYKSFLNSINKYMANNKNISLPTTTVSKISFYQPTLF